MLIDYYLFSFYDDRILLYIASNSLFAELAVKAKATTMQIFKYDSYTRSFNSDLVRKKFKAPHKPTNGVKKQAKLPFSGGHGFDFQPLGNLRSINIYSYVNLLTQLG